MNIYKPLHKIILSYKIQVQSLKFPLSLTIEPTNACNLKCKICPNQSPACPDNWKKGFMDFALFKNIMDECAKRGGDKHFSTAQGW